MKKIICMCCTLFFAVSATWGQIIDPNEAVKRKATNRANSRIDSGIDKGLDKVEEGIGSLFKKKDKKEKTATGSETQSGESQTGTGADAGQQSGAGAESHGVEVAASPKSSTFSSHSKFDFIPGEKVVAFEDFSQVAIGDFPARWNTNASGEVVTLSGQEGKWLMITQNGEFLPEFIKTLPENFTLEMDLAVSGSVSANDRGASVYFTQEGENPLKVAREKMVEVFLHPGNARYSGYLTTGEKGEELLTNLFKQPWDLANPLVHLSVWRQKGRLRVYVNEKKVADIPRAFAANTSYRMLFSRSFWCGECNFYLANLRVAEGAPDTRSKLISEGKLVTSGIHFKVASDEIAPGSFPILKEIATVLAENPGVRIKITGHTDSDGDDASNLSLSEKRAEAVKRALVTEFGIDGGRMLSDGKGESDPVDSNSTSEGKANNRRVEFTKIS